MMLGESSLELLLELSVIALNFGGQKNTVMVRDAHKLFHQDNIKQLLG